MSWRSNQILFAALALCLAATCGVCLLLGAWPVVPFAGIELGAVWLAVYLSSLAAYRREVISVVDDMLLVERGRVRVQRRQQLDLRTLKICVSGSVDRGLRNLALTDRESTVVVGVFLCEQERALAARRIRELVHTSSAWQSFVR